MIVLRGTPLETPLKPLTGSSMAGYCEESFRRGSWERKKKGLPGQDGRAGGIPEGDRCAPEWDGQNEQVNLFQRLTLMLLLIDASLPLVTRKAPLH